MSWLVVPHLALGNCLAWFLVPRLFADHQAQSLLAAYSMLARRCHKLGTMISKLPIQFGCPWVGQVK